MDEHSREVLEFPSVLDLLAGYAHSALGRDEILGLVPADDPAAVARRLDEIDEVSRFMAGSGRIPCDLPDPAPLLASVSRPDCLLEPADLLTVADYLRFLERVRKVLARDAYPALAARMAGVQSPPFLLSRIENALDERGEVRESAHPELKPLRRRQEQSRLRLQQELGRLISGPQAKFLVPDAFVTQRADRYVVPVRVEHRREIQGLVHGTSSSGATVFVEPFSVVELNNDYIFSREREAEVIRQVLAELSREVHRHRDPLARLIELAGVLDARFAVAEWAERCRCSRPRLGSGAALELKGARHPLLIRSLGWERVVPIDVGLGDDARVLVVSGPNTGGKTASLKTVGLLCLMARCGLPVPAASAEIPWFQGVFADIGDFQSIVHNLSTFSSHLSRVIQILAVHRSPALVLLDELGRGTDPVYGSVLATAVIDWFREEGSYVLATTHHRGVKLYAATTPGIRNASVLLDPSTQRPTYAIEYGVAGDSSGLEIARQLGLPAPLLARAESLLDPRDRLWEKYLQDLQEELSRVREQGAGLDRQRRRYEELEVRLRRQALAEESERRESFEKSLEKLAEEFRKEGGRYLKRLQEEDRAREARRQLTLREAALKESFRRRRQAAEDQAPAACQDSPGEVLSPGDLVYHPVFRFRGRVESVEGNQVRVDVGGKSMTTRIQDLRRIETREVEAKPSPEVTIRVVESTDPELSLIGMNVEEAVDSVDKFLDRAFVSRLPEVRIVHGFGTGRLKRSVTELLSRHPHVAEFAVEGGATRVVLRN